MQQNEFIRKQARLWLKAKAIDFNLPPLAWDAVNEEVKRVQKILFNRGLLCPEILIPSPPSQEEVEEEEGLPPLPPITTAKPIIRMLTAEEQRELEQLANLKIPVSFILFVLFALYYNFVLFCSYSNHINCGPDKYWRV